MSTATEKYQEFKRLYDDARKAMLAQSGAAFKEIANEIFDKYPGLKNFAWLQYTPYFNDGEACEFSVHNYSSSIYINGVCDDYGDEDEDDEDETLCEKCEACLNDNAEFCHKCGTAVPANVKVPFDSEASSEDISNMLEMFEDSILLDLYGDHVKVTINRDGTAKVDEYSHD